MQRALVLLLLALVPATGAPSLAAEGGARKAPTRLYPEPPSFGLLPLGLDRARFYYSPGSLDRAANLRARMEIVESAFENWADQPVGLVVFVLSRRVWEEAGIDVEYGIPVRLGTKSIGAPARGDAGTVELWSEILDGRLPHVAGTPILGTPEELASMVVSDVLVQVLAGEVLVDLLGLYGTEPWVRGVMAHLAALSVSRRKGTDRPEELEVFYHQLLSRRPAKSFSLRDYSPELSLEDWLWFRAQFHFAARAIFDKEGKKSVKKMREFKKKGKGLIAADRLRRKYKHLDAWLDESFSVVSFLR
jgi:hypothetical protein